MQQAVRKSAPGLNRAIVCECLKNMVWPCFQVKTETPRFQIESLSSHPAVFSFTEQRTGLTLVGKFFGQRPGLSKTAAVKVLNHEYGQLLQLRARGFHEPPWTAVRPLGKSERLQALLVLEYSQGQSLDYFLKQAIHGGLISSLKEKLTLLANFLATLHRQKTESGLADGCGTQQRFDSALGILNQQGLLAQNQSEDFRRLRDKWHDFFLRQDIRLVGVHGDMTPTNVLFEEGRGLTIIDLECMCQADPVLDLGYLAAEIKHHFAWRGYLSRAAEPLIRHLYAVYCQQFPDPAGTFQALTARNPYYMAEAELRIAVNDWLPSGHRQWLIREAAHCLQV